MSQRSQQREAERLARRNAYLESIQPQAAAEQPAQPPVKPAVSHAQLTANIANAQLSTGPTTEAGKSTSSQNALKHGLTGQTVLLATDDAAEYQKLLDIYTRRHAPATDEEKALVQSLLDSHWRIARIKNIESGILLKGQIEFAKLYQDQPAAQRAQLIQVETYLKYEKSIRNLNIQEARLHRRLEKDQAELTSLQTQRKRQAALEARQAKTESPIAAKPNGFVFSNPEFNPLSSPATTHESLLITQEASGN